MISSMTGYGKAVATINGISFELELKSLNSRFLELSVRLPNGLMSKEYELRELIKKNLKRGKIFFNVNINGSSTNTAGFVYNQSKISTIVDLLKKTKKDFGIKEGLKLRHLLAFRDLYSPDIPDLDENGFGQIKIALGAAIKQLQEMKLTEGIELGKDIESRTRIIESYLDTIEKILKQELTGYLDRFAQRAKDLVGEYTGSPERLEYELALIAEKSDITEECVRLRSHLKFFKEALGQEDNGRKLNFICQELHREVNTISAKSISAELTRTAIMMKEEIERIREQIQNIE